MTSSLKKSLEKHPSFNGRSGPVVVLVCDGVGIAPAHASNAVSEARTPHLDSLIQSQHYSELLAHGTSVGLPSDDDMGNSEVGHNALGAGRIFAQGAKLVNESIADRSIFQTDAWAQLIETGKQSTLHFLGLHSDGNIHSHTDHLYELLDQAALEGVHSCAIHILLDGRDVPGRSALPYIAATEKKLSEINQQYNANFRIASGGGRMRITMDRYEADWDMVKRGYDCHVHGIGPQFSSAAEAVETMYKNSDKGDQYLERFVIAKDGKPLGQVNNGDAVAMFNFRGDRAMEISLAFERANFEKFERHTESRQAPDVFYAGMLQYDGDEFIPENYLVNPPKIDNTIGEYLCNAGVRSFAISETQKYGHVTFFWNGNRSGYFDESLETYVEIPSDNIPFDEAPAMKADEITDKTIDLMKNGNFRYGRLNLANGDMVGHTGNLAATIESMEVVDKCIGRLIDTITELNGVLIVTADHGNADIMYTEKDGIKTPKTSHTLSKVPFAIVDPSYQGEYTLTPPSDAGLTHIAATTLNLLGFTAPENYQPSLLTFS